MTELNLPPESVGSAEPVDVRPETPEADALEQAYEVALDDDYRG
jgi:hypothetical protein